MVANIVSLKGENMCYVQKLIDKMIAEGKDEKYIEICAAYAQKLCNNHVQ